MTDVPADNSDPSEDLPEQMRFRRDKRADLILRGKPPYPVAFARTHSVAQVRAEYPDLAAGTETDDRVAVSGRVIFLRNTGKLCFARLRDGDGAEIQAMLSLAEVGEEALDEWKHVVDIGDLIGIEGRVIASRRGELSIFADKWTMVAKALRPLPVAHKDMSEEMRVRQRYVDLIMSPQAREMVQMKATVLRSVRDTLHRNGFLEVETPTLQLVHGGAAARPFETRLNAFDLPFYLRIALELPLKKAVVGGLHKVYEIGRVYRNEGMDSTHSPEYTLLELYEAYADYDRMAELTREIVLDAARAIGKTVITGRDGREIDLEGEWQHVTLHAAVSSALSEDVTIDTDEERLRKLSDEHDVALDPAWGHGEIVLELFEKLVEHTVLQPTFVRDYPAAVRPLARPHRDDPRLTEAWDLLLNGVELGPAYSELNDPVIQRERLVEQSMRAAAGDAEAMQLDEDFLRAMEYGMPPMGGMGMGIDRLAMLLAGVGIRETILFPAVKPE